MKKILPVKYPVITGHPSTAGLFSILGNHENTNDWIYSNYIQIAAGIRNGNIYGGGSVDAIILPAYHAEKTCPFIIHALLTRDTVAAVSDDILDFVIKMIDTDNYLYLVADQQYFIERIDRPFPHDMFIYGYDLKEGMIYAADFTFSDTDKYTYEKIEMQDFKKGYEAIEAKSDFHYYERGGVGLFHFDANASYAFDPAFVREQCREFRDCVDYSERFRSADNPFDRRGYGLAAYDILIDFLRQCDGGYRGMRKSLAVLRDHKKLMTDRIRYMLQHNYIEENSLITSYEEMYKQQDMLLLLFIKYELTGQKKYIDGIISGLEGIKQIETDCLEAVLNNVKQ